MSYAFTFDASSCSGCKACQAACKDKNNLSEGVLWRRVFEVSGGDWQQNGGAWKNTVFAYNLSISCNHCVHPKCAGVCPANAYVIRADGIVYLDTAKCMGCGYCAWACPYGAPQYDAQAGHMTKCDLCVDQLEQGLPPACVAACPLRALNYQEMDSAPGLALWNTPPEFYPFPLPTYSHSQPRLAIQPHAAMQTAETKSIANLEEVRPHVPSKWEDVPLMLFTLLVQIAIGGSWAMSWMFRLLWTLVEPDATQYQLWPAVLVGLCLGAGMLASFAHLGTKKNVWRVFLNMRKSSLSREVLFTCLFGLSWLLMTLRIFLHQPVMFEWRMAAAILGIGSIYNMSQVYRFPAAPGWNHWRTNASFLVSALLLGQTMMAVVLGYESSVTKIAVPPTLWAIIGSGSLLFLGLQFAFIKQRASKHLLQQSRIALLILGLLLATVSLLPFHQGVLWIDYALFLTVLLEEIIGRWVFYQSRV